MLNQIYTSTQLTIGLKLQQSYVISKRNSIMRLKSIKEGDILIPQIILKVEHLPQQQKTKLMEGNANSLSLVLIFAN